MGKKKERKKTMKKVFATVLLVCLIPCLAYATDYEITDLYALTTMVVEVNDDCIVCLDFTGNEWEFEDTEDWLTGDIASLLMWNNGTNIIEDDVIIQAFYCGYVPN